MVQRILPGQIVIDILNLCCDLDLGCNNPFFFSQDTQLMMLCFQTKFTLPMNRQFRRYSRKSYFDFINPQCDLDLKD